MGKEKKRKKRGEGGSSGTSEIWRLGRELLVLIFKFILKWKKGPRVIRGERESERERGPSGPSLLVLFLNVLFLGSLIFSS